MNIERATLESIRAFDGTVVVIDVLRAMTTCCYALEAGAEAIVLAGSVEEAFALRRRIPGSLMIAEVDGIQVPGADFGNSPSRLRRTSLGGTCAILRTTAGTQGALAAARARLLLGACLCNAAATAELLRRGSSDPVALLTTGVFAGGWGDEDIACGDYVQALLEGGRIDREEVAARVRGSRSGLHYRDALNADFPPEDLELALAFDRFPWPLEIQNEQGLLVLRRGEVTGSPTTRSSRLGGLAPVAS